MHVNLQSCDLNRERALLFFLFFFMNATSTGSQISLGQSFVVSKLKTRFVALNSDSSMLVTRVKRHTVSFRASLSIGIMQKINRNNESNQSVRAIVYEGKYGVRLI